MGSGRLFCCSLLLYALSGIGCEKKAPKPSPVETLNCIATVYPLADIVRQIGDSYVRVSWVIESGQSLQGMQTDLDLRNRLRNADLVLASGVDESWATEGFDDPVQRKRVIRLDLLPSTRDQVPAGLLWLDPVVARELCVELGNRLKQLRPAQESFFNGRTASYISQLDGLIQEYRGRLATARTRKLLVLSQDFNPLLLRFGLTPVLVVESWPTQLSEADLAMIQQAVRNQNTRLLVVPADTPAAVLHDLELRAGVQTVPIDRLGSSASGGRDSYLKILRYDLDELANATSL